jgi:hypothetical protein
MGPWRLYMLTRRTLTLGGVLAGLGALVGLVPRAEAVPAHSALSSSSLVMEDEMIEMVLRGKPTLVHRIHMRVLDGVDRTGGIAVLFDIPVGCRVWGHPKGLPVMDQERRIICPLFEYDEENRCIVGEEAQTTTIEERLEHVVIAAETSGFDIVPSNPEPGVPAFTQGTTFWITQTGPGFEYPKHAIAYVPFDLTLNDMTLIVPLRMVRAEITRRG